VILLNAVANAVPFYKDLGFEEADAMFDHLRKEELGLVLLQLHISRKNNRAPEVILPWYRHMYLPWLA
jgi:hypothetical protein